MNKVEAVLTLVKGLTELELQELVEGMSAHMHENKMMHLADEFRSSEINSLNEKIEELEEDLGDMEKEKNDALDQVKDLEEDLEAEKLKSKSLIDGINESAKQAKIV